MQNITATAKRLTTATVLSVGLGALAASPVAADAPVEFERTVEFSDVNPCTGADMDVTLHLDITEHRGHRNNFVAHVKRTGFTSDGYVLEHGVETFQGNKNVARNQFSDILRHDDGSAIRVQGVNVWKEDGPQVEKFRLDCMKP